MAPLLTGSLLTRVSASIPSRTITYYSRRRSRIFFEANFQINTMVPSPDLLGNPALQLELLLLGRNAADHLK